MPNGSGWLGFRRGTPRRPRRTRARADPRTSCRFRGTRLRDLDGDRHLSTGTPDPAGRRDTELRRATSLDALVTHSSPPFFLWHTAEDVYVPPEHTYRLAASLAANGVPHTVHVFAHGPHSLGLAQGSGDAAAWTTLAASWIIEQSERRTGV